MFFQTQVCIQNSEHRTNLPKLYTWPHTLLSAILKPSFISNIKAYGSYYACYFLIVINCVEGIKPLALDTIPKHSGCDMMYVFSVV